MRDKHRVVVTGLGMVTPLGIGAQSFWNGVTTKRVATAPVTRFDASGYTSQVAAEISDFDPRDFLSAKRIRWTDRYSQFAIAASRLAFDDAKFSLNGNAADVGVYLGSALGGLAHADEQAAIFHDKGLSAIHPLLALAVFGSASTCNIAIEFGLTGPTISNGNSCAAGAVAIGEAFRAIARGEVRAALAGGVEAPLAPLIYGAFTVIQAMSTRNADPRHASRPFDRDRDGFVMAEGAGVLMLERYEDAINRGASIYGEIAGYGLTNDAHHMAAPRADGEQTARAFINAISEADVRIDEIDAINAHGSSTRIGDAAESLAYRSVFGDRLAQIPVTSTKGQHGHALGATGAWEIGLALLGMRHGLLPGAINLDELDADCAIACSRDDLALSPRIVLANSSGFGGINAALILKAAA
ncbi:MAG: beta-ketoacyl-[acyl-carrier-protein] synthase family protein [Candidatus Eremiobacteraeota bacterium]|nr:beta-ketoacyl-[acyl-carrier-protein] synthase family protein [Candidatus Eremiobacteraeota bacterium]